jgi:hypothetical protein
MHIPKKEKGGNSKKPTLPPKQLVPPGHPEVPVHHAPAFCKTTATELPYPNNHVLPRPTLPIADHDALSYVE